MRAILARHAQGKFLLVKPACLTGLQTDTNTVESKHRDYYLKYAPI